LHGVHTLPIVVRALRCMASLASHQHSPTDYSSHTVPAHECTPHIIQVTLTRTKQHTPIGAAIAQQEQSLGPQVQTYGTVVASWCRQASPRSPLAPRTRPINYGKKQQDEARLESTGAAKSLQGVCPGQHDLQHTSKKNCRVQGCRDQMLQSCALVSCCRDTL
jgi:hypothetical protein